LINEKVYKRIKEARKLRKHKVIKHIIVSEIFSQNIHKRSN